MVILRRNPPPLTEASNARGVWKNRALSPKRYNTELYGTYNLQWPTNSKSIWSIERRPLFSLNGPYPWFQGHTIIQCWISQKRYEIQSFNGILIRTYSTYCSTASFRMTLSDTERLSEIFGDSLRDSWASCYSPSVCH